MTLTRIQPGEYRTADGAFHVVRGWSPGGHDGWTIYNSDDSVALDVLPTLRDCRAWLESQ